MKIGISVLICISFMSMVERLTSLRFICIFFWFIVCPCFCWVVGLSKSFRFGISLTHFCIWCSPLWGLRQAVHSNFGEWDGSTVWWWKGVHFLGCGHCCIRGCWGLQAWWFLVLAPAVLVRAGSCLTHMESKCLLVGWTCEEGLVRRWTQMRLGKPGLGGRSGCWRVFRAWSIGI